MKNIKERQVWMNGKFVPESEAKISIYDSSLMFGDMVFEMTRSFNKKQFKLREHLERLYTGIKILRIPLKMSMKKMEKQIYETIEIIFRRKWSGLTLFQNMGILDRSGKKGNDAIFYNPPAIVIVHASQFDSMAPLNVGFAVGYFMLAAHCVNLGTVSIGFAVEAIKRNPLIKSKLGIPDNHRIHAVLSVGYPLVKYEKVPIRKEPKIIWKGNP